MSQNQRIAEQLYGPGVSGELISQVRGLIPRVSVETDQIAAGLRTYVWDGKSKINGRSRADVLTAEPLAASGAPCVVVEHVPSRRVVMFYAIDREIYQTEEEQMWQALAQYRSAVRNLRDEIMVRKIRDLLDQGGGS